MIGCLSVRCTLGVVVDSLLQCLCPQADHVWFCENVLNRFVKTLFLLLTLTETGRGVVWLWLPDKELWEAAEEEDEEEEEPG